MYDELPHTGAGSTLLFAAALLIGAGTFLVRWSRKLGSGGA